MRLQATDGDSPPRWGSRQEVAAAATPARANSARSGCKLFHGENVPIR